MTGNWQLATDTVMIPAVSLRPRHQALPRRRSRSRTSASRSPPGPATRSAARTAPARARSARSSPASISPTPGTSIVVRHARRLFSGPQQALRRRHRHRPPGARVLRQPVGGREPLPRRAARRGTRSSRAREMASQRAARCSRSTGADIDVRQIVRELTIGQQQMVQIAAAIGRGARVIVFDEPTSSLSQHEADRLYDADRAAAGAAASPPSTCRTAWRRSSACATPSPCCATGVTSRRSRSRRSTSRAGRADDRPAARRVLPRARPGGARCRSCCASKA